VHSNFTFVRSEWPTLFAEALKAERNAAVDPRASCFYARRTLELAVSWLYEADSTLRAPYRDDLSARLFEPTFRTLVGNSIQTKCDLIRRQGNNAVHKTHPIPPQTAGDVLRELFHVMYWIARRYTRSPADLPSSGLTFDAALIPRPVSVEARVRTQTQLKKLADDLAERDEQIEAERQRSADLDAELATLRAEVAAAKAANTARPDDHDYDETATRDLFIDLLLKEAGWALDRPRDREFEVTGMPTPKGKGFVDYVLWGSDGTPLGLVEAKRTRKDPAIGQQQAKLYADCLQQAFGQRPVIFYTNGYEHWLWDDQGGYPPRQVQGFYTRDELALLIQRRRTRLTLAGTVIDSGIVERHYQQRAIRAIDAAFESKQREALVVMATGAGKTRTVIALVDQLMKANWVKRALFLADRVALVNQAVNAFKAHLPATATVNLVTEKTTDGRVYVSTYPTMMGLINQTDDSGRRFGPGYFDLIVIDEAHRSVYQKYRAIFDYFDSLLVGLTATPKDEVDRNTYSLFHLENGVPTDAYSLDEAVQEGYLVPPIPVSVPLKFQRQGIRYDELSEEEKDQWDTMEWSEDGDVPDSVDADAVSKWLFNTDTVDKALQTLMVHGRKVAGGDRLGKTIVFAKNTAHAEFITQRFNLAYPEYAGHFGRVITYQTVYAQSLIDDFSVKEKSPHIAISVDMLDTGIDVPEVVNLVFFKIVRSKSKFWQMIGRGTRLCRDLYGPGQHKEDFYIFDFCQNLEYFNQSAATSEGSLQQSLAERLFKARLELVGAVDAQSADTPPVIDGEDLPADGTQSIPGLRWDTARSLHEIVEGMNLDNFVVRPQRRWVESYSDFEQWHIMTPDKTNEAAEHLAGLPTAVRDDDEQAKRFDLVVLGIQLAQLQDDHLRRERLRGQVQEIASALLEQTSIPVIAAQQELLDEAAGDEWWVDVTLPMLELLRRRIRGLVKLIEKSKRVIVYTDLQDQLGELSPVELRGVNIGTNYERFRAKARNYLREHEDHVALQKLRLNRQLTSTDLAALEQMLIDSGTGDQDDITRARHESEGLGLFVRSLVGLDRAAATEAFGRFLVGTTYTAPQIHFVSLIVQHLTENGLMAADRLYESPFTETAPQGPESLFTATDIDSIIAVLDAVRAHAVPEDYDAA
jgi:type I restriction enzyme R subunit